MNTLSVTFVVNAEETGKVQLNDDDTVTYVIINGVVTAYDIICVNGTFDANTTDVLEAMNVYAMWEEVPQPIVTPTQPSQATTSVTPKTSDNTNIGYQIGVLLISLSAVLILWKARSLVIK